MVALAPVVEPVFSARCFPKALAVSASSGPLNAVFRQCASSPPVAELEHFVLSSATVASRDIAFLHATLSEVTASESDAPETAEAAPRLDLRREQVNAGTGELAHHRNETALLPLPRQRLSADGVAEVRERPRGARCARGRGA